MYLRPRQIFEKFLVTAKITRLNDSGRSVVEFKPTGEVLFGVVSSAEPKEVERWKTLSHTVTHVIIQHLGRVKAKVGDCLIKGEKFYLVQAIDDPAGLGQFTIYYCEERFDL